MMKKFYAIFAFLAIVCLLPAVAQQKVSGFGDMKLYVDPGHSGIGNLGYGGYSEAEKVLAVAYALKDYLITYTDMKAENIMFSRYTDQDLEISFSRKADEAAAMGAHLYYSIHSDASPSNFTVTTTLFLYGGRRDVVGGTVYEKRPEGGKLFGDILNADLTGAMRANHGSGYVSVGSRGNIADLTFYGSSSMTPYLAVNSNTNNRTASHLSEAGFHTTAQQNMQFVNVEYKKLQAYAAYQSLVRYFSEKHLGGRVEPVQAGIVTGFVYDGEINRPVNGAKITLTEGSLVKEYTTDTYESLPRKYTFKPEEFGNGFYWVEGFTPGATVTVKVEAEGFAADEKTVTIPVTAGTTTKDGLGVLDFNMINTTLATVSDVEYYLVDDKVDITRPAVITFSRKMDKASVEAAMSVVPETPLYFTWRNDFIVSVNISALEYETDYELKIDGSVAKNSLTENLLDGAGDGTEGSDFVTAFSTMALTPLKIAAYDPQGTQEVSSRPVVRIEFDRPLNEASIAPDQITVTDAAGNPVAGVQQYVEINRKSVLHYLFNTDLIPRETYTVKVASGIADAYGQTIDDDFQYTFSARPRVRTVNAPQLTQFNDASIPVMQSSAHWYAPTAAGQTTGIVAANTKAEFDTDMSPTAQNINSFRVDYQWDGTFTGTHLIRQHYSPVEPKFSKSNLLQYYLFGDGSNTQFSIVLYASPPDVSVATLWVKTVMVTIDWVGWKLITLDLTYDQHTAWLTGSGALPANGLSFAGCRISPAPAVGRSYEPSAIWMSKMELITQGGYANYIVTFDSQGGSATPSGLVASGLLPQPMAPSREGHTFGGWFKEADCINAWNFASETVTANFTLYAKWTIGTYTVAFDAQGGTAVDPVTVTYGEKVTEPADPTRDGFDFGGWFKEAACTNAWDFDADAVKGATTLYAKWTAIPVFAVTFDSQGGSAVEDASVARGQKVTKPAAPVREGYTFDGWFTEDDEEWNFDADVVTEDMTLFAKWTIKSYAVTFHTDGGTVVQSIQVNHGDKIVKPADPTKPNYTFAGWFKEAACANAWNFDTDVVTGNLDLYAKWNKDQVTSSESMDATPARVYPNPTDDAFTLEFETPGVYAISLTDVTGKVLLRQTIADQKTRIDIGDYPAGTYLLVIDDGRQQFVTRIVKQ